jgi:soluble cytochrome b562
MKHTLVLFILLSTGLQQLYSQNQNRSIDSIITTLQKIQTSLDEKNYTRVPNEQFDRELDRKFNERVGSEVDKRFNNLRNIVLLVLGIIGGGLLLSLRTMINNNVKDQLNNRMKEELFPEIDQRIKIYFLENIKEKVDTRVNELHESYKKEFDLISKKADNLQEEMATLKKLRIEYKLAQYKSDAGRKDYEKGFQLLKTYLTEAEALKDNGLISAIFAELSSAAYYAKKDKEMESIFDRFIGNNNIDIKENAFINIASALFYQYNATREKADRDKAIKYLNQSLSKVNDYGEALGLKLEFLMIDYEDCYTEEQKNEIKNKAKVIFTQIMDSKYSPSETLSRFNRVSTNATEKKYIDMLKKELPDEIKKLEDVGKTQTPAISTPKKEN